MDIFNKTSKELFFESIIKQTGAILDVTTLTTSNTIAIPQTKEGCNTLTTIKQVVNGQTSEKQIAYRRVDIGRLLKHDTLWLAVGEYSDSVKVCQALSLKYGIRLTETDVEYERLDMVNQTGTVIIKMRKDNPMWVGQLEVIIRKKVVSIADLLQDRIYADHPFPELLTHRSLACLEVYSKDFSAIGESLRALKVGDEIKPELVRLLNLYVSKQWNYKVGVGAFNLYKAVVTVNEPTKDSKHTKKRSLGNILRVRVSTLHCNNLFGELFIHYDT